MKELTTDDFSYWNTRIIRHHIITNFDDGSSMDDYYFGVHEVYYNSNDEPTAWTDDEMSVHFYDKNTFMEVIGQIESATTRTVLEIETTYNQKEGKTEESNLVDSGKTLDKYGE